MPVEERQNINFDHPSAFDWDLLSKHISMLRKGEAIEQPVYSYLTCTRQKETVHVEPRKVIIIEGILALSDRRLCKQMDLRIFCGCRSGRTSYPCHPAGCDRTRTYGRGGDGTLCACVETHAPGVIEPAKRIADLIVPQGGHNEKAIEILKMYIERIVDK